MINYNLNEIFAIRTELGINSESPITPHSHDKANNPLTDPFDDLIRAHLGIGEKRTMPPTEENLLRVEAKRKWVRLLPSPSFLLSLPLRQLRLIGYDSWKKRKNTEICSFNRRTINFIRSGQCSAYWIKRWSLSSSVGWVVPPTSSPPYVLLLLPIRLFDSVVLRGGEADTFCVRSTKPN